MLADAAVLVPHYKPFFLRAVSEENDSLTHMPCIHWVGGDYDYMFS